MPFLSDLQLDLKDKREIRLQIGRWVPFALRAQFRIKLRFNRQSGQHFQDPRLSRAGSDGEDHVFWVPLDPRL